MSSATELPGDGLDLRQRHTAPDSQTSPLKPDLPPPQQQQEEQDDEPEAKAKKTFGRTPEGIGMSIREQRRFCLASPREMSVPCECNPQSPQ